MVFHFSTQGYSTWFFSTENLKSKINVFIKYFNQTMAKPFCWTFQGKPIYLVSTTNMYNNETK